MRLLQRAGIEEDRDHHIGSGDRRRLADPRSLRSGSAPKKVSTPPAAAKADALASLPSMMNTANYLFDVELHAGQLRAILHVDAG